MYDRYVTVLLIRREKFIIEPRKRYLHIVVVLCPVIAGAICMPEIVHRYLFFGAPAGIAHSDYPPAPCGSGYKSRQNGEPPVC
ncbi:MAG: hypothetical protein KC492_14295 [Myxococcales bacterium]|nr:hypothetical protein [Myxococcales bacterium]